MASNLTIALVHASVGSGHRIAAESIAAELRTLVPDANIRVLDILDFGAIKVNGDMASAAFTGPTAPVYNAAWGAAGLGRAVMAASRPALGAVFPDFERWLKKHQPDVVVATHALAANLAVQAMLDIELADTPIVAVTTDFGIHGYWPHSGLWLFCVADEQSRQVLLRRGLPDEIIAVTGIPVRPQFASQHDRAELRDRLSVPVGTRLLLAIAGAGSPGPYARFKDAIAGALPALAALPATTTVVVTGRDSDYADELGGIAARTGVRNVQVLGYVEEMAALMQAADLAICKPGGLVTAECVDSGLPVVLVGPSVGQERANVRALVKAGAAVSCREPRTLITNVRRTLASTAKLPLMRQAARTLAHPSAASDIAHRVLALSPYPMPA
ncbi:MAG: glycosyltransferase [Coriobacteriia bacterium]